MQIYVNLFWSYAEYPSEGTTDCNTADPLAGHLKLLLTKMHACFYVCVCPGCEDGDPDEGLMQMIVMMLVMVVMMVMAMLLVLLVNMVELDGSTLISPDIYASLFTSIGTAKAQ